MYQSLERFLFTLTFKVPGLREAANAKISEALIKIEEKVGKLPPGVTSYRRLPKVGMKDEQIIYELQQYVL
jgi:hypothetical protein